MAETKQQQQEASTSNEANDHPTSSPLLELPPEMIDEIMKRLDPTSLHHLRNTSKYLRERVENFKVLYKNEYHEMLKRQRAYVDEMSDGEYDEEDYNWGGDGDYGGAYACDDEDADDHYLNDMLDRLSCGSNYDEDLDELLNGQ